MSQSQPVAVKKAGLYLGRSLRLRCPVCGQAPLFRPIAQLRGPLDWFQTLPGCPHCRYVYDREPGYFMLALWTLDYGAAAVFGVALAWWLLTRFELSTGPLLFWTLVPTALFAVLVVRHAKAIYLAIDHYFFHDDTSPGEEQQ